MEIDGTDTHDNLARALAREAETHQRNTWFAQRADIDGYPGVAALFRAIADAATAHAHGALEFLADAVHPDAGRPIGDTADNLACAEEREMYCTEMYPEYASTAREEGFGDIAEWFDSVARAHRSEAGRLLGRGDSLR